MRRALLALAVAVVLYAGSPVRADDLLFPRFGDYLEVLRSQAGIPGLAAAIVGQNDILWERAYGQQDIARSISTRTDTPFQLDGLTQLFTATLVLRCVEEGRLSLDDAVGQFDPNAADGNATIGQLLTHTSGQPDNLIFAYRPDRLDSLAPAIAACRGDSFRKTLADQLDRLAMIDSVPGPDALYDSTTFAPPSEGALNPAIVRYAKVFDRLAVPYAVDSKRHSSPSEYNVTTLRPASGLISTAHDFAKFDTALKQGVLLQPDTIAAAWRAPAGRGGQRLPHGLGWFVQPYNGETIVWQFGVEENASSSLVVTARGLTLILLANSDGLARSFALEYGDLTSSPFGRVFLGFFVR
jgi:CubicO group peptidase (beta-lactamase class C family)